MANWQRGVMRAMRIPNHPVTVREIHDMTPRYRRIVFAAPDLVRELEIFPTFWLRLWVPHPAKGENHVSQRGYTFVDIDADAGRFSLEFVLHEVEGPAGDWAKQASIGDSLEVALTPARIALPEDTTKLILAGDVTALAAINSWLRMLPDGVEARVFIEDGHDDARQLPAEAGDSIDWTWVPPDGRRGAALASAIAERTRADEGTYAWAAGERTLVKAVRHVFKDHLRLDRGRHFSQFYWIEGRSSG